MYTQNPYMDPMLIVNRNKNYVMQFLCSPVVLVLAILQALSVAINFFSAAFSSASSTEFLNTINLYINGAGSSVGTDSTSAKLSITLPVVPIAATVAFFLLYFCSKAKKQGNGVNSGATILFILAIFSVVKASFLALIVALLSLSMGLAIPAFNSLLAEAMSSSAYSNAEIAVAQNIVSTILIIACVILALVATYSLFYSINYLRFTSSLKKSLSSHDLPAKGAKAFGVMNVISAVFTVFAVLTFAILFFASLFVSDNLALYGANISGSSLTVLAAIYLVLSTISFIYYIFSAKFAFGYNNHIAAAGPNGVALPLPVPPMTPPIPDIPFCQPAPTDTMGATEPIAPEQIPEPNEEPSVCEDATVPCEEAVTEAEPTESAEPAETTGPTEKACGNCGTPMAENQRFCSNCGTPAE